VTPGELFAALDGRELNPGSDRFLIEVFSVSDQAGQRWVQLALEGAESRRLLTVRLKTGDSAQHVLLLLSSWLRDPAGTTEVFNVA